jgi:hypothetical protein
MTELTKYIQCYTPELTAGDYSVHLKQTINSKANTKPDARYLPSATEKIENTLNFYVDAARFVLNPTDIYSVYPPAAQNGAFSESIAQIVFTRRTLPWERTLDGKMPAYALKGTEPTVDQPIPWMALILINEDQLPDIMNRTLREVIYAEAGVTGPAILESSTTESDLKLMPWERSNMAEGCQTIDITAAQFNDLLPTIADLPYLAHIKEVNIANKDKNGIVDIDPAHADIASFAVVIGNRLPTPNKRHIAVLVSLEGFGAYLKPDDKLPAQKNIPTPTVRMVVLAHWLFYNEGQHSFLEMAQQLQNKKLQVYQPKAEFKLAEYLDMGYTPMQHLTRSGVKNISWYRGPLTPLALPKMDRNISYSSSDSALRYDAESGFYDVSYAAAWQIGKLLALQNLNFSQAMVSWRNKVKLLALQYKKTNILDPILQSSERLDTTVKEKLIDYIRNIEKPKLTSNIKAADENDYKSQLNTEAANAIPAEVKTFLGDLFRLKGVPFNYIVSDELYLEKGNVDGTIGFFYIDPNWVESMLDGAISIGRMSDSQMLLDNAMAGNFAQEFYQKVKEAESIKPYREDPTKEFRLLDITGFLLRSNIISGWRGLEIEAFDASGVKLPAFRFERIDNDIMLGIYNGKISKVVITEPQEGLFFGIKSAGNKYNKNIKSDEGKTIKEIDRQLLNNDLIRSNRTIKIAALAAYMKTELHKNIFTSAEFALQMVNSPVKYEINVFH